MNDDLLPRIVHLLSAVPTSPSHDQLDVTIYENGFATSSMLTTPVLSDSGLSDLYSWPGLFVAIRSVLVHTAIRWPTVISAYQIVDSLRDALFILGECQIVFCRSELALLISAHSPQDIVTHCHLLNDRIPWGTLMALDAQTKPMAQFANTPTHPPEWLLNLENYDLVNEYDGPLFDDWNSSISPAGYEPSSNALEPHHYHAYYPPMPMYSLPSGVYSVEYSTLDTFSCDVSETLGEPNFAPFPEHPETVAIDSYEDTSSSPSPSSTRSSPFPETPAFDNFHSELPQVASPMSIAVRNATRQEEQIAEKVMQVTYPNYPTSPALVAALSPLSECESLPSSRCPSTTPSSQSSEDSASSASNEEILQVPIKIAGKKTRRTKTGGIKKKKTKSKEKHFCCYCNESFTRDHDAERHQRTCKLNPNCSQKEQCKVCTKALPVRLDARRRHWGTLECSDAARKLGYTRVDEEIYELL